MSELRYLERASPFSLRELREFWEYRDVFVMLVLRDLKIRYRQALVGMLWAILQPLGAMIAFALLFYGIGKFPTQSSGVYFVSAYVGLMCWQLFAQSVREGSNSLVANRNLITKVYFPRLLLPAAVVCVSLLDWLVAALLVLPLLWWSNIVPGPAIVLVIPWLLCIVIWSLSCSIWMAALNAFYRDVGHLVPFLLQIGMIASPVVYETGALVPPRWQTLYGLNPLVGGIEGVRGALLQNSLPPLNWVWPGLLISLTVGLCGIWYFRVIDARLADRV